MDTVQYRLMTILQIFFVLIFKFITDTYTVAKVTEGRVKLEGALGQLLHLVAEALEAALELVSQLPLRLLRREVVTVVHVLVLAEVRCDFTNLARVRFKFHNKMRTSK